VTQTPLSRSKCQRSKSPGRFTQRDLNAWGKCSGDRENVLGVGSYCYVASARRRARRWGAHGGGEGRGNIVSPRVQLVNCLIDAYIMPVELSTMTLPYLSWFAVASQQHVCCRRYNSRFNKFLQEILLPSKWGCSGVPLLKFRGRGTVDASYYRMLLYCAEFGLYRSNARAYIGGPRKIWKRWGHAPLEMGRV